MVVKKFQDFGLLREITSHKFFSNLYEAWEYRGIGFCLNDGKHYPIVYSSVRNEYGWLNL